MGPLSDRYERIKLLGSGGFGAVWLAKDHALDDLVAIKVLAADQAIDPGMRARFVREARLLRRVRSDRVVAVHDIGELADGTPYFVMAYAEGGTLDQRLGGGALPVSAAVHLAGQAALGVAELHRHGLVHRDIKPSNVLFSGGAGAEPERLLIGDLGLAIDADGSYPSLIGGTPAYMAPEQARGAAVDASADVYALGALTYRLITGTLPGGGAGSMRALVPDVPLAVDQAVMRALADHPGERQRSAIDFAAELRGVGLPDGLSTTFELPGRRRSAARLPLVAAVLVALTLLLVGDSRRPPAVATSEDPAVLAAPNETNGTKAAEPSLPQPSAPASATPAPSAGQARPPRAAATPTAKQPESAAVPVSAPVVGRIDRFTGSAATTGWNSIGPRTSQVRVSPRSLAVVTSTVDRGTDNQSQCTVSGSLGTWTRLAEVTGTTSKLWLHTWFNNSDSDVYVTVKSTFVLEHNRVTGQEVEVLSGVADPAVTTPRTTEFTDADNPMLTAAATTPGSRLMAHFISTSAPSAPTSFARDSQVSASPASVVYDEGETLALGVIFRAVNTATPAQTTVGATHRTPAPTTGVVVEYLPAAN